MKQTICSLNLKMKILIIGKNGQLGKSINKIILKNQLHNHNQFVFTSRKELDLSIKDSIINYFNTNQFDIVVNCAAYTAVDKAESEEKKAKILNHIAIQEIALLLKNKKTKLIHISTDYVFDGEGKKPYKENDPPNPINVYGRTKLLGELAIIKNMPKNALIIRTSWLYSEFNVNFVTSMLRLGSERNQLSIVSDQIGAPTYAVDLAKTILTITQNETFIKPNQPTQIYHYSNLGSCSWFDFAKKIFELANINCKISPIKTKDFDSQAKRPLFSIMNKNKILNTFDLNISNWKESLNECIKEIIKTS